MLKHDYTAWASYAVVVDYNKGKIESKKSFISELSVIYVYKTLTVIWKHEYEAKDVQSIVIQIQSLSNRRIV